MSECKLYIYIYRHHWSVTAATAAVREVKRVNIKLINLLPMHNYTCTKRETNKILG